METFKAYVIRRSGESLAGQIEEMSLGGLPEGDVLVKVHYSGVNFKDGLASVPEGKVVKEYPIIPGIDLAKRGCQLKPPGFSRRRSGFVHRLRSWNSASRRFQRICPHPGGLAASPA